jgi:tetratricopeptide (TPR) repeat protein
MLTVSRRLGASLVVTITLPLALAASAPSPLGQRPALSETLDRYTHGEWARANVRLDAKQWSATVHDLRHDAPAWIQAGPTGDRERRRLAVATYALELVRAQGKPDWQSVGFGFDVIEWACDRLAEGAPTPGEATWQYASVTLMERLEFFDPVVSGAHLRRHLDHASRRFPDPAHASVWAFVSAIAEELPLWPVRRDDATFAPPAQVAARIEDRFREASRHAGVRQEAQVRWGYFELRRGRVGEALDHFRAAGESNDPFVQYLLFLFKGRALEEEHQLTDAIAAYRRAVEFVPDAQSAALSLASALAADHRPDEAADIARRTLTITPVPDDPWTIYLVPDDRWWPRLITSLRKAIGS